MRFTKAAFSLCLVGSAVFGLASSNAVSILPSAAAQDEAAAEAKAEPYVLDESIFDIKEGQDGVYYKEAEKKLREEMSKFIDSKPERDAINKYFPMANGALQNIYKCRLDAKGIEGAELASAIRSVGNMYADSNKIDELKALMARFADSQDAAVVSAVKSLEGALRFAELVGKDVLVEGLFLDGKEIKWEDYRGKVVLIDFWATWCGPCRGEIPNVKELYAKYHEAGFEVVGYSIDQDLDALKKFEEEEKLPWQTMSRKMSLECKDKKYTNLSEYYGVTGIPTMILVGKDGKAIDTNARGAHLKELLEKQFPEVK